MPVNRGDRRGLEKGGGRDSAVATRGDAANWPTAKLKFVTRFGYGDALPTDEPHDGPIMVFGSNGAYGHFSRANTGAPAIVVGRKGSYGKVNWTAEACFASDTTFFVDTSTTQQDLRWVYWLLQTLRLDEGTDEAAVPGLNRDTAYEKTVRVPPPPEQRAIADYLDRETARIDALIAAKERVLGLLAEKRRALITRAVTRGLDPHVLLRESGIPWLGKIPAHWELWKLGHVALVGNGSTPSRENPDYWQDGTIPWLNSAVVNHDEVLEANQFVTAIAQRECHLPLVKSGSVLVGITGQGKTRGQSVVLSIDATINQHLAFITPNGSKVDPWFLRWTLFAAYEFLRSISDDAGGTKGALTCEEVANLRLPLPDIMEQRAVIDHIARNAGALAAIHEATQRTIDLLEDRRAALIAATVTGQIDLEGATCD